MALKQHIEKTVANKTTQQVDLFHRIWEGSVGISLKPQLKKDGTYFWKYSLTHCYKPQGTDEWRYDNYFSRHNDEAIALLLSKGFEFMNQNDATEYANQKQELAKAA